MDVSFIKVRLVPDLNKQRSGALILSMKNCNFDARNERVTPQSVHFNTPTGILGKPLMSEAR